MASKKKSQMTVSKEWAKHLRKLWKREFWKRERKTGNQKAGEGW